MIGDLCRATADCCGVLDQPGSIKTFNGGLDGGTGPSTSVTCQKSGTSPLGVCTYVSTVCSSAGQLCKPGKGTVGGAQSCSTKDDCCAGNDNQYPTCQIDQNGIPRCTIRSDLDCSTKPPLTGTACASSADCCGGPCIKNPSGDSPAFICGTAACRQQSNSCTSTADCCSGLPCAIPEGASTGICGGTLLPDGGVLTTPPPGTDGGVVNPPPPDAGSSSSSSSGGSSSGGVCALYGQACTGAGSGDCCSAVPCVNGTCHYP
jgi:hypothetical protein